MLGGVVALRYGTGVGAIPKRVSGGWVVRGKTDAVWEKPESTRVWHLGGREVWGDAKPVERW
jgi:hypothetical protein